MLNMERTHVHSICIAKMHRLQLVTPVWVGCTIASDAYATQQLPKHWETESRNAAYCVARLCLLGRSNVNTLLDLLGLDCTMARNSGSRSSS